MCLLDNLADSVICGSLAADMMDRCQLYLGESTETFIIYCIPVYTIPVLVIEHKQVNKAWVSYTPFTFISRRVIHLTFYSILWLSTTKHNVWHVVLRVNDWPKQLLSNPRGYCYAKGDLQIIPAKSGIWFLHSEQDRGALWYGYFCCLKVNCKCFVRWFISSHLGGLPDLGRLEWFGWSLVQI